MRAIAAMFATLPLLACCAKQLPEPALTVAAYCEVARPIYWSAKDTRRTKEQADRENAKWKRLCVSQAPREAE